MQAGKNDLLPLIYIFLYTRSMSPERANVLFVAKKNPENLRAATKEFIERSVHTIPEGAEITDMDQFRAIVPHLKDMHINVAVIPSIDLTENLRDNPQEGMEIAQTIHASYPNMPIIALGLEPIPIDWKIPGVIDLSGSAKEYFSVGKVITALP